MKKFIVFLLVAAICFSLCACSSSDYKKAVDLFNNGKYKEALLLFESLGDYENSVFYANESRVSIALDKYSNDDLEGSLNILYDMGDYATAQKALRKIQYEWFCNSSIQDLLSEVVEYENRYINSYIAKTKAIIAKGGGSFDIDYDDVNLVKMEESAQKLRDKSIEYSETFGEGILCDNYTAKVDEALKNTCDYVSDFFLRTNFVEWLVLSVNSGSLTESDKGIEKVISYIEKLNTALENSKASVD